MRRISMPSSLARVLAGACFAALLAEAAVAQPPPTFEERIDVTEVLLDVVAVDKKGRVVEGLGVEDFVVEENGEPVTVTDVNFYTTRYGRGDENASDLPASRYFILFFHDQRRNAGPGNLLLQQQLEAGRESRRFIESKLGPSDFVAVVSYDVKLEIHQDFTQDRASLLAAIEAATAGGKAPGIRTPSERRRAVHDGPSIFRNLPPGPTLDKQTTRIYDAIRVVAEASGYLVGRKSLLLFSIGFGRLEGSPIAQADPRYYPQMERALNANNVAIYPLDLTPVGVEHIQEGFLNQLADDTGGVYYRNFVSFATPLGRIADENIGYYLLSYRTNLPKSEDDAYRQVSVKTTRSKVIIRAPRGVEVGS